MLPLIKRLGALKSVEFDNAVYELSSVAYIIWLKPYMLKKRGYYIGHIF